MEQLLRTLPENPSVAKYRNITEFVRSLIASGKLKPGTRLPPIKTLARQWNTNYFTVRLALTPLANEGLIERSPGRGSFVRDQHSHLSSVAIYYGGNLWVDPEGSFYQKLYYVLQTILERKGIRITTFIDTRLPSNQGTPLPELQKAIEKREVQGVISPMISPDEIEWVAKLGIPYSVFGRRGVGGSYTEMVALALDRFARDGCKTVGAISPENNHQNYFEQAAAERGLKTTSRWCHYKTPSTNVTSEMLGYRAFKEIWAQQTRPEGLFIQPDWICRGAITAILELGVNIPDDLRLVLYRNDGVEYLCPWTVPTIVLNTEKVAEKLVDVLENAHRSGKPESEPSNVPVSLVG
jgi:DNA-binding LacI/PurR family transcriptional regulator